MRERNREMLIETRITRSKDLGGKREKKNIIIFIDIKG